MGGREPRQDLKVQFESCFSLICFQENYLKKHNSSVKKTKIYFVSLHFLANSSSIFPHSVIKCNISSSA